MQTRPKAVRAVLLMGEGVTEALDAKYQVGQQQKLQQTKNQTTMQPPRECKGQVKVAGFLGRLVKVGIKCMQQRSEKMLL